jgi:E3 ubiquitin-protein ligase UBR7
MEALSSMDRVKQVEAIHGYNSMKSNLMEYLKKFAENKKVVREEDIQEFFTQMKGNKRPRVEIPKSCK